MAPRTTKPERELAHRASDAIDVSLRWNRLTNRVTVKVYDARSDEGFELEVDGRSALDAYRHPSPTRQPSRRARRSSRPASRPLESTARPEVRI
jgi:hypothetical protein